MKKLASLTLSLFLLTGTAFADSPKDTPKDTPKDASGSAAKPAAKATAKTNEEIAAQLEELRQAMQAQQEQLQLLKEELAKRDRQIEEAREAAAAANAHATEATTKATEAVNTSSEVKSTATALNSSVNNLEASNAAMKSAVLAQGGSDPEKGPSSIRYKGITLTPGGFLEAATVNRQRATSADINTPFTGIPYPGNALSHTSEMNFSARQSRLTLLAEGKVGSAKVQGYFESDFLGAGTTSNNRQSNSYVFRMRQGFARVDFDNGWSITGGQSWSLATENRKGIINRQEWLPLQIDPQYVVGFTWQRAPGLRVTKSFGDRFTIAASMENPQTTLGGRGFSSYSSTNASGVTTTFQNFFEFAPGASGGLYNAFDPTGYSVNKLPDFIVKAAADPGWGHYEVFGIVSTFRNRVYPCAVVGTTALNYPRPVPPDTGIVLGCSFTTSLAPSSAGAHNDSRTGGGLGASALVPLFGKKLDANVKVVYGDGIGRFGSAQLPDVTARPDGTLALIHTAHWLGALEWHATPKLDLYAYLGGEYAGRAAYSGYNSVKIVTTPAVPGCGALGQPPCPGGGTQPGYPTFTTTTITENGIGGYGSRSANNVNCGVEPSPGGSSLPGSGSCAGDIRYIGEGTVGFWHKLYQGDKGRVQWGIQYSYLYKTGWSGSGGVTGTNAPGIAPHAVDNMVLSSFRFYIP
jgi:hypothetical protein